MPDWLINVLVQYPIVVVVGLVGWYAYRELKAEVAERTSHEREQHANTIADLKAENEKAVTRLSTEIAGLKTAFVAELKKLGKTVDELNRRLGG